MHASAVVPAPNSGPTAETVKRHDTRACSLVSSAAAASRLLKDATVGPLPAIDTSRTFAAKLCGRLDDAAFNVRVITLTRRLDPVAHAAGAVVFLAGLLLVLVPDGTMRAILTYATTVAGCYLTVHVAASLSYDMIRLVTRTFEFWFLFTVNLSNVWLWIHLFDDVRAIGFASMGVNYALTLFTDANSYTRRYFTRQTVFASPGLFTVIIATALRLPPDVTYPQYRVVGLTVDAVDLLVNGNLIIAYFTAIRVVRSQHLVCSRGAIERIECDMYFPTCHLVPQCDSRISNVVTDVGGAARGGQLELIQNASARGIDTSERLIPWLANWTNHVVATRTLGVIGLVGVVATVNGFIALTIGMDHWTALPTTSSPCTLEITAFTCSLLFCLVVAAHWQPVLAKRVSCEIDAWFVVFQMSVVSLGACDLLRWAPRPTLLIVTASLWCLWILFLDAVPMATRRRLRLSRWFVVLVIVCLDCFPLILSYWLYFSPAHDLIHDRELLHLRVGTHVVKASLLGFVSSKLATLWIWMGRFLWRELFRPTDAFKLIKRRVFYRVRPVSVADS